MNILLGMDFFSMACTMHSNISSIWTEISRFIAEISFHSSFAVAGAAAMSRRLTGDTLDSIQTIRTAFFATASVRLLDFFENVRAARNTIDIFVFGIKKFDGIDKSEVKKEKN